MVNWLTGKTRNKGESLSGKSVNRSHLFTHSPIHLFTYSPAKSTYSPIHPFTDKKGITLIELVISMVLMGIVALVVANALSTGVTAFFTTDNRKEALDQGRIALDRMAKEIRNLNNSASVSVSSATQFCFTDTESVQINYSYSGTDIKRDTGNCTLGSGSALSANINSFSFSYIRADGTVDAAFSAANTKKIRITLTSTSSNESVSLQTEVWPRNL